LIPSLLLLLLLVVVVVVVVAAAAPAVAVKFSLLRTANYYHCAYRIHLCMLAGAVGPQCIGIVKGNFQLISVLVWCACPGKW
jgi:hypothetical protein